MKRATTLIIRALASQRFFYLVLAVAALQAVWYAFSFQPRIFDEPRHLGVISVYAQHLSPFLSQQPTTWDHLGDVTRDGSYLFYYLMSWPLRLLQLFTDSAMAQVIGLRLVCTAFFLGGLVLYRKALLRIPRVSRALINSALLLFVLTPAVALLPGAVNYDNLAFLLFGGELLLAIKILQSRKLKVLPLIGLLILGLVLCEVKWSSIALVVPVLLYVLVVLWRRHGLAIGERVVTSARHTRPLFLVVALIGLLISVGLFIERPVANTLNYGRPEPVCSSVLTHERCLEWSTYHDYAAVDAAKPADFQPKNPVVYFLEYWTGRMINTQVNQLERTYSQVVGAQILFTVFALSGFVIILAYFRDFWRKPIYGFLLFVALVYVALLFAQQYMAYINHGIPAAIRSRYLMPVMPIFIYFAGLALTTMFAKYKHLLIVLACLILIALSQGGGIATFLVTTPSNLQWNNSAIKSTNNQLRQLIQPFIKS